MAAASRIEWTETTWNPVTGCTKISPGCKNCYAEVMARRLKAMKHERYLSGFQLTLHPELLEAPLRWRKPRVVLVNSMSDLFHEEIPEAFIRAVFNTMGQASKHTFQVLTKRSSRLYELAPQLGWHRNVWVGVSVEDRARCFRIDDLRPVPAPVRFLSIEPLLEDLGTINLAGVNWVIVGGESGHRARPMRREWVRSLRDQCLEQRVPFFFKQWGGVNKKMAGRELDGLTWSEMPMDGALTTA